MGRLCSTCGKHDQWLPVPVDKIRVFFKKLIKENNGVNHTYELRSNIAYNIQYIEYLDFTIQDLKLTSVLWTQTVKNFIITGTGVVEAILYYVVRSNGLHRENSWKLTKKVSTNQFKIEKDNCKIENHFFIELKKPIEEEMSLDSMLKKVEKKKLLGNDRELYKKLNYLRKLRNRVHLHLVEDTLETDWHTFNNNEYALIKEVLFTLFTSELLKPDQDQKQWLSFLHTKTP